MGVEKHLKNCVQIVFGAKLKNGNNVDMNAILWKNHMKIK